MKYFISLIFFYFYVNVYSIKAQQDFYTFLANSVDCKNVNVVKINITEKHRDYKKTVYKDSTIQSMYIYGKFIKFIKYKNSNFSYYIDGFLAKVFGNNDVNGLINDTEIKIFYLNNIFYVDMPIYYENCNGTSCRVSMHHIIKLSNSIEIYSIFQGTELMNILLLNDINKDGNIDFIYIENSFFSYENIRKYANIDRDKKYYMICIKTIVNGSIIFLKNDKNELYNIVVEVDEFYNPNTYKVINKKWIK